MGPNENETFKLYFSSHKSQPIVFKPVLNFLTNGPNKPTSEIFEILSFQIFIIFFSKIFKFTIVAYG